MRLQQRHRYLRTGIEPSNETSTNVLDVEAVRGQWTMDFALWAMSRSITIRVSDLLNILLDRAHEGV